MPFLCLLGTHHLRRVWLAISAINHWPSSEPSLLTIFQLRSMKVYMPLYSSVGIGSRASLGDVQRWFTVGWCGCWRATAGMTLWCRCTPAGGSVCVCDTHRRYMCRLFHDDVVGRLRSDLWERVCARHTSMRCLCLLSCDWPAVLDLAYAVCVVHPHWL